MGSYKHKKPDLREYSPTVSPRSGLRCRCPVSDTCNDIILSLVGDCQPFSVLLLYFILASKSKVVYIISMICLKCNNDKPEDQFYSYRRSRCKTCIIKGRKLYYLKNKEYYRSYQKSYRAKNKEHCAEYHKAYRARNKEYFSEQAKKYRKKHRAQLSAYYREWYRKNGRKRNKKAATATGILNNAIFMKRIKRPSSCEMCNREYDKINGHHEDYSEPLAVIWVCHSCHGKIHSGSILVVTNKP